MKKIVLFVFALIILFSSISCEKNDVTKTTSNDMVEVESTANYTSFTGDEMSTNYVYDDEYFLSSAIDKNDNLADMSLVLALAGTNAVDLDNHKYLENILITCKFNNIFVSEGYKGNPTSSSIGYLIASKILNDDNKNYLLLSVGIRGFKYDLEWVSNFKVGKEGNHNGFDEASSNVYDGIVKYLNDYNKNNYDVKLWITGYSRAGAVAGLTSTKLVDNNIVKNEELYAYTFEAPSSILKNDKVYNVFNYINSLDIVPKIIPDVSNIIRPGKDILIDENKNLDVVINNLNEITDYFKLEKYNYENVKKSLDDMIDAFVLLFDDIRNEYVDKYQDNIMYLIEFAFYLDKDKQNELIDYFKNNKDKLVISIFSKNGISNLINNALSSLNIGYDNAKIQSAIDSIADIFNKVIKNVSVSTINSFISNASIIIPMHCCEYTLAYFRA